MRNIRLGLMAMALSAPAAAANAVREREDYGPDPVQPEGELYPRPKNQPAYRDTLQKSKKGKAKWK